LSALNIHANALGHFLDILFLKALGGAFVTISGTDVASFDFLFKVSKIHLDTPFE
tara:strand:+ start:178 stop:342 length:165 start_codon:yes stop_codon:yes gene_type:complete